MGPDPQANVDIYKFSLLFDEHLNKIFDSVTGYSSQLIQDQKDPSVFYLERKKRPGVRQICNETGGDFLVAQLRESIYNKHTAMASLNQDEIADVCADGIMAPIDAMMFYQDRYDIRELVMIETVGLDIENGAYTFLTALRDGELRKMMAAMTTVTIIQRPAQEQGQVQQGLLK